LPRVGAGVVGNSQRDVAR